MPNRPLDRKPLPDEGPKAGLLYSGLLTKLREQQATLLGASPVVAAAPPAIDPEVEEALRRELRLAAKARGRSPIISTDSGDAPVARKSLLGQ